jgi:hypothetical protein
VVQWKEVLKDLNVEVVYALSPAAKHRFHTTPYVGHERSSQLSSF